MLPMTEIAFRKGKRAGLASKQLIAAWHEVKESYKKKSNFYALREAFLSGFAVGRIEHCIAAKENETNDEE